MAQATPYPTVNVKLEVSPDAQTEYNNAKNLPGVTDADILLLGSLAARKKYLKERLQKMRTEKANFNSRSKNKKSIA